MIINMRHVNIGFEHNYIFKENSALNSSKNNALALFILDSREVGLGMHGLNE